MPFTVSHAVVALPLARIGAGGIRLPFAAVAIGAMTPDLSLFLHSSSLYVLLHEWPTLLAFGVPLGLALLVVWRTLLRPAAAELAPEWIARRLPAAWEQTAAQAGWELVGGRVATARRRLLAVGLAIVATTVGVITHVVWDAFTHPGRWGSEWFPALGEQWGPVAGTTWLQHGSSVFGLAVLAIVGFAIWRAAPRRRIARLLPGWVRAAFWLSIPSCLVISSVLAYRAIGMPTDDLGVARLLFRAGVPAGTALLVIVGVAALVVAVARVRRAAPAGESDAPRG